MIASGVEFSCNVVTKINHVFSWWLGWVTKVHAYIFLQQSKSPVAPTREGCWRTWTCVPTARAREETKPPAT